MQAAAGTPDPFAAKTYAKVTRRIIPVLLLSYIAAYLDRINIGFGKLQMQTDLHFTDTVFGLGAGIFFLGYFLLEVPSNLALHRFGARLWIARIMIGWGIISGAMMFVDTRVSFYIIRFLLGAAEAGFFPGIILYLTYWYPAHRRGRMTTLFMTSVPISGVIGGVVSGWIMQNLHGVAGLGGWQWLFLLEALPSVIAGIVVIVFLDDGIEGAAWLDDAEKHFLQTQIARDAEGQQTKSWAGVLTDPRLWHMVAIYFCLVMGLYGVGFWLPTLIKEGGVKSPFNIGLLSAIPYAAALAMMIVTSRSSDRRGERRWHVALPAVTGCLGLVASALYGDHIGVAIAALSMATAGTLTSLPIFWSLPTGFLRGAGAAAGIAIINSFGNLAGFVSPYLVGWLNEKTHNDHIGLYVLAGFLLAGAGLTLVTPASGPIPKGLDR